MKIKIGIIGVGFVCQISHLKCLKDNPNVTIEAICDQNSILLKQVSKKYKIKKTYTSYVEMINQNKLDGIVLCVNRDSTEKVSKFILKNKVNLFTEKPSALSSKVATKLSNLAKKNNCIYLTGYMKRHDKSVKKFAKKLKNLDFGDLKYVYYEHFSGDSYGKQVNYFKSRSLSQIKKTTLNKKFTNKKNNYLKFLNTHCHTINLIRFLIGDFSLRENALNKYGEGNIIFKKNKIEIILKNKYQKSKKWHENVSFFFEQGVAILKLIKPFLKESSDFKIIDFTEKKVIKNIKEKSWAFQNQINFFVSLLKENKKKKVEQYFSTDSSKDIAIIEKIFKVS